MSQPIRPTPRRVPTVVRNSLMNYGFTTDPPKRRWIAPWAESGFTKPLISGKESRQFWNITKGRGNNLIGGGYPRAGDKRKRQTVKGTGIMEVVRYLREVFLDEPMRRAHKAVQHVLSVREGAAQGWATMPRGHAWHWGTCVTRTTPIPKVGTGTTLKSKRNKKCRRPMSAISTQRPGLLC